MGRAGAGTSGDGEPKREPWRGERLIRAVQDGDAAALWRILEPIIRAGETYPLPRDMDEATALAYWRQPAHEVFVAEQDGRLAGTYYLKANSTAGGGHVANCGYMVATDAWGKGIGRALCLDSFERARRRNFRAMQFNLVIATNERAVHLWQSCGMDIVGRLPGAFHHPRLGYVDALVMYKTL